MIADQDRAYLIVALSGQTYEGRGPTRLTLAGSYTPALVGAAVALIAAVIFVNPRSLHLSGGPGSRTLTCAAARHTVSSEAISLGHPGAQLRHFG